jgi:hypothetical protein
MASVDKSSSGIMAKACSIFIFLLVFVITIQAANGQFYLGKNKSLGFDFSFTTGYDDNILKYSDSDLDHMDDPTVPENKYGIESQDDLLLLCRKRY